MKKLNDRILFILSSVLLCLMMIFALSFFTGEKKLKIKSRQSALLNPKYNITGFTVSALDSQLKAKNIDGLWCAELSKNDECLYLRMDKGFVNNFISFCQKVSDFNIITESVTSSSKLKNYCLDDESSVCLSFSDDNSNTVSKIYFGALNQTLDKIFFRTEKNLTVYSMDSKIEDYLNTDSSFWCDKEMIPEAFYKNKKESDVNLSKKKISSLRFSKIVLLRPQSKELSEYEAGKTIPYKISDATGTEYSFDFFPSEIDGEQCYAYSFSVKPSILFTQAQKDFISKLNGFYCISEWTFNLLKSTEE